MGGGPIPIGIEGLNATPFTDFRGGRVTADNLSEMRKEELLLANNILIQADRMPVLRPGYSLVANVTAGGKYQGAVIATYDYQRSIDGKQFLIVQLAPSVQSAVGWLLALDPANQFAITPLVGPGVGTLTAAQVAAFGGGKASFVEINSYELLVVTPNGSWVLLDMSAGDNPGGKGTLIAAPAGIIAPADQPNVAGNAGAVFTLVYGWTYSFCYVRQWTDAQGTTRYHIGPPTISQPQQTRFPQSQLHFHGGGQPPPATRQNFVGPGNYTNVTVTGDAPPTPFWNYVWIFRTNDTPLGTTSSLFYAGQVALAAGQPWNFTDAPPAAFVTVDDGLDETKPIPYDNYPPPGGSVAAELNSRVVIAGIPGSPSLVQMTGYEEILLGVPQEACPQDLFFEIPTGIKAVSTLAEFNENLYISSVRAWFALSGFDISTFQLRNKVCEPGPIGPKAFCTTHTHLVYLSEDKLLWGWDGVSSRPVNFAKNLSKQLVGALSMEDIDTATLAQAELQWFHRGRYNVIAVMVNTGAVPPGQYDWIQLWDASFLGETYDDNVTAVGLVETDFFPSDTFSCSAQMLFDDDRYMIFGDPNGNIYRWPDGTQDNGKNFAGALCTAWSPLNVFIGPMFHPIPQGEVTKRLFWADMHTDREDALESFGLAAVVADSPDMNIGARALPLQPLLATSGNRGPSQSAVRGRFYEDPKLSMGRWCRVFVIFPDDGNGGTLVRLSVSAKPMFGVAP